MVVTDKSDADWWEGHIEGRSDVVGFFPASFVELIEDGDVSVGCGSPGAASAASKEPSFEASAALRHLRMREWSGEPSIFERCA